MIKKGCFVAYTNERGIYLSEKLGYSNITLSLSFRYYFMAGMYCTPKDLA
jgi:hypothetical protein